jgi:hypothetical protein
VIALSVILVLSIAPTTGCSESNSSKTIAPLSPQATESPSACEILKAALRKVENGDGG